MARVIRSVVFAFACALAVVGLAACGSSGGVKVKPVAATDPDSGISVKVAGTKVTVARSETSTAGTGGYSGQVACVDDYKKLAVAPREPAPDVPWYAATLITWPAKGASSTATLSHKLAGDLDLCVAQTSDGTTQSIVYFRPGVRAGLRTLQQSIEPKEVLEAAASLSLPLVYKGAFPAPSAIVSALNSQSLYVQQTPTLAGVTKIGVLYVITGKTTKDTMFAAIKGTDGKLQTVTQGVKGQPKLGS